MIIINDSKHSTYYIEHPQIVVYNLKERFSSISKKIEWGYKQCKNNYIYRLDDDDLLAPNGLNRAEKFIKENEGYDIYRSKEAICFVENKYENKTANTNTGNIYKKEYFDRIKFHDNSFGEDYDITFKRNGKIYEDEGEPTMVYRWGMNTYHVSGMGNIRNQEMMSNVDKITKTSIGKYHLNPHFNDDYYKMIDYT